jgi:hypothetical protein
MSEKVVYESFNKSYPLDLGSISVQHSDYRLILNSNVCTLHLKSVLTSKIIEGRIVHENVDDLTKTITMRIEFTPDDIALFNYILDRSDIDIYDIYELASTLESASTFFRDYEISRQSQNNIDRYISSLGKYKRTWHNLTEKPDYNMTLYRSRILPYFDIECKNWVKANIDAIKQDYPSEMVRASIKREVIKTYEEYLDEARFANRQNNFLEWNVMPVTEYPDLSKLIKSILIFAKLGLTTQAYMMFMKLLITPTHCHICKSSDIWKWLNPKLEEDKDLMEIIKYCYSYAMYILRQEETVMFSQVNLKYRVLITLDEAVHMPTFHNTHIERSPYILQLTGGTLLRDTMPYYLTGKRSINNIKEFNRRFDIATGGAFRGVDFKALGAAITGSILIPCVQKSPLENGFNDLEWDRSRSIKVEYPYMIDTPTTNEDIAFANFLEYYYPSYVSLSDDDYKKQVLDLDNNIIGFADDIIYEDDIDEEDEGKLNEKLNEKLSVNLKTILNEKTKKPINSVLGVKEESKNNKVLVDADIENKSIKKVDYNQLADIDISITTRDYDVFKKNALALYEAICRNCSHRGLIHIKQITTIASIKYKIYGPGISRPMDIFRIPYDPAKMVKKFHVHPVKMFYDNNITMFRSCLSCLLSGVGENYKWFSCNKVAADVLLKYAQRGFTIILNDRERAAMSDYIIASDRWNPMIKKLNVDPTKIYCVVSDKHSFFRPGMYNSGCRKDLRLFERNDEVYTNTIVMQQPKNIYPYGKVHFKDATKIYKPKLQLISSAIDYINTRSIEDNDDDAYLDNESDLDNGD